MNNMELYNRFRTVPEEAKKPITAGRLKGMTDINPMWRIKMLTEAFGPCGEGWRYSDVNMQLCPGANDEIAMFVTLNLWYKQDDKWSEPVPGVGGSTFVAKEKNGLYTDDEAYKKALTDALSVACKALGIGADVYFAKDRTKYTAPAPDGAEDAEKAALIALIINACGGAQRANAAAVKKYGQPLNRLSLDVLNEIYNLVVPKDEDTGLQAVCAV